MLAVKAAGLDSRTSVRYTGAVRMRPIELQLPLDTEEASTLARLRLAHLDGVDGLDGRALVRLVRAFPSLRAVYTAPEPELARLVGPVAAARIRWFLDAPLDTALAREAPLSRTREITPSLPSAA
jgi:ERCC4-type nuclease